MFTLAKNGSVFAGKGSFTKYDLTEDQLNGIASVCQNEQGTPKGAAAEASLIANRFELYGSSFGIGADGLYNYLAKSGWFANAGSIIKTNVASQEIKDAVRTVLVGGKRTVPGYVDEHVTLGRQWITSATNDGVGIDVMDRSAYVQNKTLIQQSGEVGGGKYTFFCFPETNSDPFGYTSEQNRQEIGDFYYDFDSGAAVNGKEEEVEEKNNPDDDPDAWRWPVDDPEHKVIKETEQPYRIGAEVPSGSDVYACFDGVIGGISSQLDAFSLETDDGYMITYEFVYDIKVNAGDHVKKGDVICKSNGGQNFKEAYFEGVVMSVDKWQDNKQQDVKDIESELHFSNGWGNQSLCKNKENDSQEGSTSTSVISSLDNVLFIGDSILGTCKDGLEGEGAKVLYQVSANANFFLGEVTSPHDERNCELNGENKFDWDKNIGSQAKPTAICLMLGPNACGGGTSGVDSGINDIKRLVEKLKGQFSGIPIFITSVVPCTESSSYSNNGQYNEDMKYANESLKTYCSDTDGLEYIDDLDGYIDEASGCAKGDMASSDGLHPNGTGAKKLIENIKTGVTGSHSSDTLSSSSGWCVVVATYTKLDDKMTISKQKIDYQTETSKYATPLEFLSAQLQVTNDVKYVQSICDMVINNSKIDYLVQDQYTKTVVTKYEQTEEKKVEGNYDGNSKLTGINFEDAESTGPKVVSSHKNESLSIVAYIKDADTWIMKVKQKYAKRTIGPTTQKSAEETEGPSYNASKHIATFKRSWTTTETYTVKYEPTVTMSSGGNGANSQLILGDNATANKIIQEAHNQIGVPYVWGGTSPAGFDCSGLVQYCCIQAGANTPPRSTGGYSSEASQYEVPLSDIKPGDVLWREDHVAIYIGNNQYIHAPGTGKSVTTANYDSRQSGSRAFSKAYRFW